MSTLIELQQAFQSYLLTNAPALIDHVVATTKADAEHRLRVYFDAYRLRLVEALATDYEALRALLGVHAFTAACRAYIEVTPSEFRNLRFYGGGLADFLRLNSPWRKRPILHELALFEWTLTFAFDAPDAAVIRFEELARLPQQSWPGLGFVLHPSARFLELRSNAPSLRKAVDTEAPLPKPAIASKGVAWLIWRKALSAYFRSLGAEESWALAAVSEGANFAALCEGLCRWCSPDEAASRAATLLRQWVDDELISDLTVAS